MPTPVTIAYLLSFLLLAVVHYVALQYSLYWHWQWFDLPMHALGGTVVILGVATLGDLVLPVKITWRDSLFAMFMVVMIVMVTWEVFEYVAGVPLAGRSVDTAIDILMGFVGGIVGVVISRKLQRI